MAVEAGGSLAGFMWGEVAGRDERLEHGDVRGFVVAGVHDDDIVADYLLTNNHERMVARLPLMREYVTETAGGRVPSDEALMTAMRVEADYLEEAFRVMREAYGSLDGYLDQVLGLNPELRERLHDRLLA